MFEGVAFVPNFRSACSNMRIWNEQESECRQGFSKAMLIITESVVSAFNGEILVKSSWNIFLRKEE